MNQAPALPLSELLKDRAESVADIDICERALALGITRHRDGMIVQYRIDGNKRIIEVIDAEIARREAVSRGGQE